MTSVWRPLDKFIWILIKDGNSFWNTRDKYLVDYCSW